LGWIAFISFSNSARVITVLQSAAAVFPAVLSHKPCTVITGASGATLDAPLAAGEPGADILV
jgi:hypothetical protein